MPRPRLPQAKAEASGAVAHNAGRFKDRATPKRQRPLGDPYQTMTAEEKQAWAELRADMAWLRSTHRVLVRMACVWIARLNSGDDSFGVKETQALSSILSKLGATPTDETKVNHGDGDEADPEDKFFSGTGAAH